MQTAAGDEVRLVHCGWLVCRGFNGSSKQLCAHGMHENLCVWGTQIVMLGAWWG